MTDRTHLQELTTVWQGARHLSQAAAAVVMTLRRPDEQRYLTIDQYDLGQATMAMMVVAADLGIGSGHSAIGDEEACRRILGIPEDRICAYMLLWAIRLTGLSSPSSIRIVARSMRSFTEATGRSAQHLVAEVQSPGCPARRRDPSASMVANEFAE